MVLHSLNSSLKIGEITAAGLKLFRPEPKQQIQQDPVKETRKALQPGDSGSRDRFLGFCPW